jgi:hypothetical protein
MKEVVGRAKDEYNRCKILLGAMRTNRAIHMVS